MGVNRIITRGMGSSRGASGRAGLVTQGFGGVFRFVVQKIERVVRQGRSSAQRALEELQEIKVWVKLTDVNNNPPSKKIEGFLRIGVSKARNVAVRIIEGITTKARPALSNLRVIIDRIK